MSPHDTGWDHRDADHPAACREQRQAVLHCSWFSQAKSTMGGPVSFSSSMQSTTIELPLTPARDDEDLSGLAFQIGKHGANHTQQQKKQAVAAYHALLTMTGSYVGQLFDALELDGSTIVVFTSDDGSHLNEHGGLWRKSTQFEESMRVPLIVRFPQNQAAGQVAAGSVELSPTLVDLTGLPKPSHAFAGTSFKPLLADPTRQGKSAAFSEYQREGYHGCSLREIRH